jgi:hypothetical protein
MLLGVIQIALQLGRRKPIDVMLMSVFLDRIRHGHGADGRSALRAYKPTAIYAIVGM